jgi:hypothetical protein
MDAPMTNRRPRWNAAKRDASVAQFRHMMPSARPDKLANAVHAGKQLKRFLDDAMAKDPRVRGITSVDDLQLERYRRRFSVPKNLRGVMFAVATHIKGTRPVPERCPKCSKKYKCLCLMENQKGQPKAGSLARKVRKPHPLAGTVVSERGIPLH